MSKICDYQSEDELLSNFRAGDEKALNHIFKTFYTGLCFFADKLTADNGIAEELTIDVFEKAWNRRQNFHNLLALKTFLYVSVKNASLNYIDKQQRKAKKVLSFIYSSDTAEAPIVDSIIHAEIINELLREIEALPEQCSKVMKMLYLLEMTPDEIAVELNISRNTVYSQKMRGIALLKKRLTAAQLAILLSLFIDS